MAAFNWPSFAIKESAPTPGVYIDNADNFSVIGFFPTLPASINENTANDFDYYPYDRIFFSPRGGENWIDRWGAYAYIQNTIYTNVGTEWAVTHVCTNQENILDYGIHTGLYTVWGNDGKAYGCAMYPGASANEVGGVVYDVETGSWTSFTQNVGGKFSNCAYPIAFSGRLALPTQGDLYLLDPANLEITRLDGPVGTTDARDKLAIFANRLFWIGKGGSDMKIWEGLGGTWIEMANLENWALTDGGEWALIQDFTGIGVWWYSGLRNVGGTSVYFSQFKIQAESTTPLSSLSVTDLTSTYRLSWVADPGDPPTGDYLLYGCQEGTENFGSGGTMNCNVFSQNSTNPSTLHPIDRGRFVRRPLTIDGGPAFSVGPPNAGGNYYTSSRYGYQDTILNRQERPTPYKIESSNADLLGSLKIHYYAHTQQSSLTMSSRVYYRDTTVASVTGDFGPLNPDRAGTVFSTSVGTINADGRTIDNVLMSDIGTDNSMVWDAQTDLSSYPENRITGLSFIMNFPGSLPAL